MKKEVKFPVTVEELRKAQEKYEESLGSIEKVRHRRFHWFKPATDEALDSLIGDLFLSIVVDKCGEDKECFVSALNRRSQKLPCILFLIDFQIDLIWKELQEKAQHRRKESVFLEDGTIIIDLPFSFRRCYFPPDPPQKTFEQKFIGRRT